MDNRIKTLFKSEIKKVIWLFVLTIAAVYIVSVTGYNKDILNDYSTLINNNNTISYIELRGFYPNFSEINLLWLFALVFFQFSSETNLWCSLPYSKKELHYTKIFVGTLFITLVFLYFSASSLSIFNDYRFVYDEILSITDGSLTLPKGFDLFLHIVLVYIIYLFSYYLLIFLQYKTNSKTIGLIFGGLILFTPALISNHINMYAHPTLYRYLLIYFSDNMHSLMTNVYSNEYFHISMGNPTYFELPTYIFYTVLAAIFFVVASRGNSAEDTGILCNKVYGKIFVLLITVFFGLLGLQMIYLESFIAKIITFIVFGGTAFAVTLIILKKQGVKL